MPRRGENIRKRNDGRWEGRYLPEGSANKKYHSVYASTYTEVKMKLEREKINSRSKIPEKNSQNNITFRYIAEEWLQEVHANRKHATYVKYRNTYNLYIDEKLGSEYINQLNSEKIRKIIPKEISYSVQKTIYCIINQICYYGNQHYQTLYNKFQKGLNDSKKNSVVILTLSEQARLINSLYADLDISRLGILLCLSTGIRLGEVCALRWDDIDMELKTLHINRTVQRLKVFESGKKTKLIESVPKSACSRREIPLSDEMFLLLKPHWNEGKYVLGKNEPMDPRTLQYRFKKYLREAGVEEKNFHVLRHTFATNCIDSGADIKCVSELLGHADVQITLNRYVHPSMDKKRNSINSLFSIYGQFMGQL